MSKKQKIILMIVLILTLFIVFFALKYMIASNSLNRYNSNTISFYYDNTWTISKFEDNIYLVDENGSSVTITLTSINEDLENKGVEEINNNVVAKLMSDNESYKKIVDERTNLTSVYYNGYKTLLENDTTQALVFVTVTNDYILTINYTAANKYFDMSLDSVENIVGSIAI